MKPALPKNEKNFSRDMKAYERQPEKNKELANLKDRAEKSTGRESVVLQQKIRDKTN